VAEARRSAFLRNRLNVTPTWSLRSCLSVARDAADGVLYHMALRPRRHVQGRWAAIAQRHRRLTQPRGLNAPARCLEHLFGHEPLRAAVYMSVAVLRLLNQRKLQRRAQLQFIARAVSWPHRADDAPRR